MSREERIEMLKKEFSEINTYNRPTYCAECGAVMVFKGLGEYQCEKCGARDYDDYGKVRNYAQNSAIFLKCEICGATIRSGKYCPKCEMNYHHDLEEMARKARHHGDTFGYSTERRKGEDGSKRFTREQ